MYTHRLFLKDGHTFMTDADRALMEQYKETARLSAIAAAEDAERAREHASTIDTKEIHANIALKADNLYFDSENNMLYLTSNGETIGDGVSVSGGGNANNAKLILRNTTGWIHKNVEHGSECTLSLTWSSLEDGMSTGTGDLIVMVGGVLQYSKRIAQGAFELDVKDYLSEGYNNVRISVTDVYGNSRTIAFNISSIIITSTKLVDRSLTGDYVNDRVTSAGAYAFYGLTLGKLSLPNVSTAESGSIGVTANVVELPKLIDIPYWFCRNTNIELLKLPSATSVDAMAFYPSCNIKRVVMNNIETINERLDYCGVRVFDFHKLTSLCCISKPWMFFNVETIIIRTPSVCALGELDSDATVKLYVPASLVDSYKTATNWSAMADRIFAIEDHPEICEVKENG
jgi:hypothetical protein